MSGYWNTYFGPTDVWRRFLAGMTVTRQNWMDDTSLWVAEPATRYDLQRFGDMVEPESHG